MTARIHIVAGSLGLIMASGLIWATLTGDFGAEGRALMALPWGVVSLMEIYVGLGLFFAWVFYREPNWLRAALWLVAAIVLGNIVSCCYVLVAASTAKGDAARSWCGHRAAEGGNA